MLSVNQWNSKHTPHQLCMWLASGVEKYIDLSKEAQFKNHVYISERSLLSPR